MPEVIADTSPLQYLYQIRQLELLQALYGTVLVPSAVAAELARGISLGVSLPWLERYDWLQLLPPADISIFGLAVGLGQGEREVLAVASARPEALALLDDGFARRFAKILKVRCTGTLGILLKGKQQGLLPAVLPAIESLEKCGFRLDAATRLDFLQLAGEVPR
jgi:predicted nucleic acid-binding protein